VGETVGTPGAEDHVHGLLEAGGALLLRDAEGLKFGAVETPSGAPVHPAAGEDIEECDLLGETERVVEGGEGHGRADPKPSRACGNVHAHHVHGGTDAERMEMVLRKPDRGVAGAIHDLDALERPRVDRLDRDAPLGPAEELQHPDLHGIEPRTASRSRKRCTLPVAVRGNASSTTIRFGRLKRGRASAQARAICSRRRSASSGAHTTQATSSTRSLWSAAPTTAHSRTPSTPATTFSTSSGETHWPDTFSMSSVRPTTRKRPSVPSTAWSPVTNQSPRKARRVASARCQ